ncbi:hypothetical protein HZH66_008284 [Vespula vulgaris]|uniref:Uncharacterized protein n=1 Tax=Vespula vulgaris TaxID=7454 RepID=A0A834JVY2_VESVU|nr:hypothetical protein HZH66_008284 [Vespula vulgaris]
MGRKDIEEGWLGNGGVGDGIIGDDEFENRVVIPKSRLYGFSNVSSFVRFTSFNWIVREARFSAIRGRALPPDDSKYHDLDVTALTGWLTSWMAAVAATAATAAAADVSALLSLDAFTSRCLDVLD